MREVGASKARTHFSALLDEVARGETIIITKPGRPVASLRSPEAPGRQRDVSVAGTLSDPHKRVGWATTEEILQMQDEGQR